MKSKKILKSKKGILLLMLSLIVAVAMVVPTTMSALARVVPTERLVHPVVEAHNGHFVGYYADLEEAVAAGRQLNQRVVEEGAILLKNEGGMLPFGRDVRNISLFGIHSAQLRCIVPTSPRTDVSVPSYSLRDGLRAAGFNVNPHLDNFYANYTFAPFTFPNRPGQTGGGGYQSVTSANAAATFLQPGARAMLLADGITPNPEFYMGDVFGGSVTNSFRAFGDAAMIVLTREITNAGPGNASWNWRSHAVMSHSTFHPEDHENSSLELIASERALVYYVASKFDNVVVLLHNHAPMQVQFLENHDGVSSILKIGSTGTDGIKAIGRILNGEVNPSGRVANMHADQKLAPSFPNTGIRTRLHVTPGANTNPPNTWSNLPGTGDNPEGISNLIHENEEGIYVGSRYFETRGWEMGGNDPVFDDSSLNTQAASVRRAAWKNAGDWDWYDEVVTYPLGFGLSYTNFEWDLVSTYPAAGANLTMNCEITVRVRVRNVGFVPGQDVVQLYYTTNYIVDGVEKPFVVLQGFEKTRTINPGGSQIVTLSLSVRDMASWDFNNLSGMGPHSAASASPGAWGAWVINAGAAQIRLMRNANVRSQQLVINYNIPATVPGGINSRGVIMPGGLRSYVDATTGNPVRNRFTVNNADGSFVRLTEGLRYRAYVPGEAGAPGTWSGAINDELLARHHQRAMFNTINDFMTILSRADFDCDDLETGYFDPGLPAGTGVGQRGHPDNRNSWPRNITEEERVASPEVLALRARRFNFDDTVHGEVASQPWYKSGTDIPANWTQRVSTLSPEMYARVWGENPTGGHGHGGYWSHNNFPDCGFRAPIQLHAMRGVPFGHADWVTFMNQLTLQEMIVPLINTSGWGTGSVPSIGKPRTQAADGAIGIGNFQHFTAGDSGFNNVVAPGFGTAFGCPAMRTQTWNNRMFYAIGRQIGLEGQLMQVQYLYTNVMDIRRTQLGTRVWEGSSEDPFLIGSFGMWYTRGAQDVGTAVATKHFMAYSGYNAGQGVSNATFGCEQSMREIHAEPFRMVITPQLGGALSIMSAYNATGMVGAFTNYALNTEITIGEWDFQGWMLTDSQNQNLGDHIQSRAIAREANTTLLSGNHNFMTAVNGNFANQFRWNPTFVRASGVNGALVLNPEHEFTPAGANIPSHSMYYAIRMSAKRVLFAAVNTNLFTSSPFLYRNILDQWLGRPADLEPNEHWHNNAATVLPAITQNSMGGANGAPQAAGINNVNVRNGLTVAQLNTLIPSDSTATFRLSHGSTLPIGLMLTPDGNITNRRYRNQGPDGPASYGTGNDPSTNTAYARSLIRPAESSTVPHTFQVDILTNGMFRARKTFQFAQESTFVLGDGFTGTDTVYNATVANGVAMHVPYQGLTVGQAFNGQIQGVTGTNRVPFHFDQGQIGANGGRPAWQATFPDRYRDGWLHTSYRWWYNLYAPSVHTDFSIVAGSLPAGLSLSKCGAITGTPLASGQFNYTIRAHRIHNQRADPGMRTVNHVFYIHHTMVVNPAEIEVGDALTIAQVQALIDAAVANRLTAAQVQEIIDTAIANRLTAAQVQELIDAALAAFECDSGCSGFATADSIALFVVLAVALAGVLLVVTLRKKKTE